MTEYLKDTPMKFAGGFGDGGQLKCHICEGTVFHFISNFLTPRVEMRCAGCGCYYEDNPKDVDTTPLSHDAEHEIGEKMKGDDE